jgi:hypothetical protein
MLRFIAVVALLCAAAKGEDAQLTSLRATLVPLRPHQNERREVRGATPALTVAKHQLRDWIESRLAKFPEKGDGDSLFQELHDGLSDAGVFCDACPLSALGYVDETRVRREAEFLVIQTSVGIWCGYDDSAYVYAWTAGHWSRIWEGEQNVYTKKGYHPQTIHAVHISTPDSGGSRLLLTLGSQPGCSAAFEPIYFRLFRLGSNGTSKLLFERSELANVGEFPPVKGRVGPSEALIEFTAGGTGYGFSHIADRHYEVSGAVVRQVDPIAPNPRDFVEEWLAAPWSESAKRSESAALREWHAKLHRDDGMGDFPDPILRCSSSQDLWQVGIKLHDVAGETYYFVRWQQPFRFTMMKVSERPDPTCTEPDGDAARHRTLFAGQ